MVSSSQANSRYTGYHLHESFSENKLKMKRPLHHKNVRRYQTAAIILYHTSDAQPHHAHGTPVLPTRNNIPDSTH